MLPGCSTGIRVLPLSNAYEKSLGGRDLQETKTVDFRSISMRAMKMGQPSQNKKQRRGGVTLELILVMPVMIIFVLAAVEFGLLLSQIKQVEFASREGARLAAVQTPGDLSTAIGTVSNRVERVLQTGEIPGYCKVILQHNVAAASNPTQSTGSCNCPTPTTPALPSGTNLAAVRVTVCVGMEKLAPDLLSSFGLSLNGKIVSQTTTWPYVEVQNVNYSGNIYVANTVPPGPANVTLVDPNNANRSIVSAAGTGTGPVPLGTTDIVWDDDNQRILYSDRFQQSIVAVDPATGNRTVISASSGSTVGTGPALLNVSGLALEPSGTILALTSFSGLIRINPATGDRTVLSSSSVGTGSVWLMGDSVVVNATGEIYVLGRNPSLAGVYAVNAVSGNRSVVTADTFSTPPQIRIGNPADAIFNASGDLLIASNLNILSIDVVSGTRTQVSGAGQGTGSAITSPQGIAVQTDGTILVSDSALQAVLAVDPVSGNRTPFSGSGTGTGSNFGGGIRDLTIVP